MLPGLLLAAADSKSTSWGYEACDQYPYPDDPGDGALYGYSLFDVTICGEGGGAAKK